jgi:hypothetical protein
MSIRTVVVPLSTDYQSGGPHVCCGSRKKTFEDLVRDLFERDLDACNFRNSGNKFLGCYPASGCWKAFPERLRRIRKNSCDPFSCVSSRINQRDLSGGRQGPSNHISVWSLEIASERAWRGTGQYTYLSRSHFQIGHEYP